MLNIVILGEQLSISSWTSGLASFIFWVRAQLWKKHPTKSFSTEFLRNECWLNLQNKKLLNWSKYKPIFTDWIYKRKKDLKLNFKKIVYTGWVNACTGFRTMGSRIFQLCWAAPGTSRRPNSSTMAARTCPSKITNLTHSILQNHFGSPKLIILSNYFMYFLYIISL